MGITANILRKPAGILGDNYFIWICSCFTCNEDGDEFPFLFNLKKILLRAIKAHKIGAYPGVRAAKRMRVIDSHWIRHQSIAD